MPSDADLILRFVNGQEDAFDALYRRHVRLVYAVAFRMTHSPEDARDLCQETFLQVYRGLAGLREPAAFVGWLRQITVRLCLGHLRRRETLERASDMPPEVDARPLPDRLAEAREAENHMSKLLDALPAEDRAVIVLRDIEGLPYQEIADAMGWTLGNMKTRLHRARATLARKYRQLEGN
ncbi:RNA polymerase sigma factor SigE [Candidatus Poribacteria bacterium]|nr:RNA polymerase sigma factor SigE [Candidatus Poribacteria bacterium]